MDHGPAGTDPTVSNRLYRYGLWHFSGATTMIRGGGYLVAGLVAIKARLLLVLALALFGAPQDHVGRVAASAQPAAANQIQFASSIPAVQSQILRAQHSADDTPQIIGPVSPKTVAKYAAFVRITWEQGKRLSSIETSILPPVRGPPAV
ncbi:MAG: hypothetical protein ACJASV_002399 [Pseudorhodobacter sp.]